MTTQIQFKRGTTAEWVTNATQVLAVGEFAFDTDKKLFKVGDGATQYGSLPYYDMLSSVFLSMSGWEPWATYGTPTAQAAGPTWRFHSVLFDPTTEERISTPPPAMGPALASWGSADLYIHTVTPTAQTANNAYIVVGLTSAAPNADVREDGSSGYNFTAFANCTCAMSATQGIFQRHGPFNLDLSALGPGWLITPTFIRQPANAADTYAGDVALIGAELIRKT